MYIKYACATVLAMYGEENIGKVVFREVGEGTKGDGLCYFAISTYIVLLQ